MAITYEFAQAEAPEDIEQRTIVSKEVVTENKENTFTLAQKDEELKRMEAQVIQEGERIGELKTEIATIKTALGLEV